MKKMSDNRTNSKSWNMTLWRNLRTDLERKQLVIIQNIKEHRKMTRIKGREARVEWDDSRLVKVKSIRMSTMKRRCRAYWNDLHRERVELVGIL